MVTVSELDLTFELGFIREVKKKIEINMYAKAFVLVGFIIWKLWYSMTISELISYKKWFSDKQINSS